MYIFTLSLTSALDGVDGQRDALADLSSGKRFDNYWAGGLVSPRVGLDGCGKSRSHQDSIRGPSRPSHGHYIDCAIPASIFNL
jgi:hypothetical protein